MSKKGFTLIELLITITIIVILAAIGIISYQSVLKSGRDSKRQSDLQAIQSALEQYHNDQGFYPTATGLDNVLSSSPPPAFTSSIGNPTPPANVKTYMNSPPQDPNSTSRYKYMAVPFNPSFCDNSTTKCTSYCLYAKMENTYSSRPALCVDPDYNFIVTPP